VAAARDLVEGIRLVRIKLDMPRFSSAARSRASTAAGISA